MILLKIHKVDLALSSLWDRAPKDCTEGKSCSKALSQPQWKPSHATNKSYNRKIQYLLWRCIWTTSGCPNTYMSCTQKPHTTGHRHFSVVNKVKLYNSSEYRPLYNSVYNNKINTVSPVTIDKMKSFKSRVYGLAYKSKVHTVSL